MWLRTPERAVLACSVRPSSAIGGLVINLKQVGVSLVERAVQLEVYQQEVLTCWLKHIVPVHKRFSGKMFLLLTCLCCSCHAGLSWRLSRDSVAAQGCGVTTCAAPEVRLTTPAGCSFARGAGGRIRPSPVALPAALHTRSRS